MGAISVHLLAARIAAKKSCSRLQTVCLCHAGIRPDPPSDGNPSDPAYAKRLCKVLTGTTASAVQAASDGLARPPTTWKGGFDGNFNCASHNSCHFVNAVLGIVAPGQSMATTYFPAYEEAMFHPKCK